MNSYKSYKAMSIAAYIISKSNEIRKPIDNLKLQKLLYYVQGASICNRKRKIMFEDDIYAYMYGPVVKNVYEQYRHNVVMNISYIEYEEKIEEIEKEDKEIIDFVIYKYQNNSSWSLVEKTQEESPWKNTREGGIIEIEELLYFFNDNKEYKL